ncbi:uncharacterized protein [Macrobrachium rosenbergii]|uniref:uncharacterized protein n=1 Tax=Macrobrachium rosenbergii TaxID=79674 RepID=UPI0034D49503
MDWTFIFFGCCLLSLGSLSSAHSASESRTTSRGDSTIFFLPEEENVVVAFLTEGGTNQKTLNYRFFVHGRQIKTGKLEYRNSPSQWKPLLFISNNVIKSPFREGYWIPTNDRGLKGRQLEVSSSHRVKWQVLSLPLNNYGVTAIPPNQESPLNLPEHSHVWIVLWNKNGYVIRVRFSSTYENTRKVKEYNLPAHTGWLIASISTGISFYGNGRHERWVTQLQQRDLRITTNYQLQLQVFPMPSEPEETSKLPDITTGMSTVTPTSKPEGPPTVTPPVKPEGPPTVTPPVKPEGPPTGTATGIPVSTLIIIGVVVALLVVVAASCLCYRCYFKKQNETRAEDTTSTAMDNINPIFSNHGGATDFDPRNHGTISHPDLARQSSSHDSENSIYGVIVPH